MAKSKKKKNKDFQKVKLKVGRRLQKADNVTNASFHSRSIQIVQHIKAQSDEPSTRRNLNITDLLAQCQHYSISTRHDALTGLRELISTHPELLRSHLASLLERVSQLFTDKDPAVRMATLRLLKAVLPSISLTQIQPFFPVVSAYLCCAMTHIYEDIQADSLQILDILLETHPTLIIQSSSQILPNFVDQISRQKFMSKSQSSRSLTVNPNSKMASQKWRTKVLQRLYKLLTGIIASESVGESPSRYKAVTVICNESRPSYSGIFSSSVQKSWYNPGYRLDSLLPVSSTGKESANIHDELGMQKFVTIITPLLIECWVEASAVQLFKAEGNLLSWDALSLKLNVLKVIQLLWKYVAMEQKSQVWLKHSYQSDFVTHFLQNFPFSLHSGPKKIENSESDKECSALALNLGICDVMTYFLQESANQETEDNSMWLETVCDYLSRVFHENECIDHHNMKTYIQILSRLVDGSIDPDILDQLYTITMQSYLSCHPLSSDKKLLLRFFADVVLKPKCTMSLTLQEQFFLSLPELFTLVGSSNHQIALLILQTMKRAACCNCHVLLHEFIKKVLGTENLITKLDNSCQRLFAELLFFLTNVECDLLEGLATICRVDALPLQNCLYIIHCLNHRFWRRSLQTLEETANHISFLISVSLNIPQGLSLDINSRSRTSTCQRFTRYAIALDYKSSAPRALSICQTVNQMFRQFSNEDQVIQILSQHLQEMLRRKESFLVENVSTMLMTSNQLQFYRSPVCDVIMSFLTDLSWGFLLALAEESCHNDKFDVSVYDNVLSICKTFITSDSKVLEEFCRNLNLSLKGVSNEDEVHVLSYSVTRILQDERSRQMISSMNLSNLLSTFSSIKERFPDLTNRQWWADLQFVFS